MYILTQPAPPSRLARLSRPQHGIRGASYCQIAQHGIIWHHTPSYTVGNELFAFYRAFSIFISSHCEGKYTHFIHFIHFELFAFYKLYRCNRETKLGQTARESQTWPNCEGKPNLAKHILQITHTHTRGARSRSIEVL